MTETYKIINSFEDYAVSNMGKVKRITNGRHTYPGRILSQGSNNSGYKIVILSKDGKNYGKSVHRLVAEAFLENTLNYKEVDHINGDKTDNRACNLRWCTHKENMNNIIRTKKAYEGYNEKYKVSHPEYGVWYATSIYKAAKTIGCNPSLIYNNIHRKNIFKGWTLEKTDIDFSSVPNISINAENDFIIKLYNDKIKELILVNT